MTQPAIAKMLKKYAEMVHDSFPEVPLDIHAHQIRYARASHWLEEGINIVQISFLLGHAQLQTTMIYLDITDQEKLEALSTLETDISEPEKPKWKNDDGLLMAFCGLR